MGHVQEFFNPFIKEKQHRIRPINPFFIPTIGSLLLFVLSIHISTHKNPSKLDCVRVVYIT